MISPAPNQSPLSDQNNNVLSPWKAFFTDIFNVCVSVQSSGITANRPVKNMWIGKQYFDTTIGKPIYWNGTIWVKADGTAA